MWLSDSTGGGFVVPGKRWASISGGIMDLFMFSTETDLTCLPLIQTPLGIVPDVLGFQICLVFLGVGFPKDSGAWPLFLGEHRASRSAGFG